MPTAAVHLPVYCLPEFSGKSGAGAIGDALMELDDNVGRILDAVEQAGIADNTIFIFTSDNGPEFRDPWRGTAGPWTGCYNTAMEGSLRVPFLIRWPGRIPAGLVSDGIVHIADLFTTLADAAGATAPTDRAIDGVDQMAFFTGQQKNSSRDGFPVYFFGELYAVKWHEWKMHFIWRPVAEQPSERVVKLFNLRSDPKEETDVYWKNVAVADSIGKIVADFQSSLATYPLIKPGTPDPYQRPKM